MKWHYLFLSTKIWVSVGCTKPVIEEESPGGDKFLLFSFLNQARQVSKFYSHNMMSFSCKTSLRQFLLKVLYLFLWKKSILVTAGSAFGTKVFAVLFNLNQAIFSHLLSEAAVPTKRLLLLVPCCSKCLSLKTGTGGDLRTQQSVGIIQERQRMYIPITFWTPESKSTIF